MSVSAVVLRRPRLAEGVGVNFFEQVQAARISCVRAVCHNVVKNRHAKACKEFALLFGKLVFPIRAQYQGFF